jgi:probable H4MPT-linked C1 transfer pathway protein
MKPVIGWDIGGAHLKAARVENGRITQAVQVPCPLWLGLDKLDTAFAEALRKVGEAKRHAITMTGELADAFPSRAAGVEGLAEIASKRLAGGRIAIYAGRAGFLQRRDAQAHIADIASANWHASARWAVRMAKQALFVDMGSTTTDLIPLQAGRIVGSGYTDAERLAASELVYTGLVRTSLMSVTAHVPLRGTTMRLMNEHFATMSDVYRILGELPAGADQQATADGRSKSVAASRARLARMVGFDATEAPDSVWSDLAAAFREAQLRGLHDAAALVLSRHGLPTDAPLIGAGVGARIVRSLAARLRRPYLPFSRLLPAASARLALAASNSGPAAAVALLAEADPPNAWPR